MLGGHWSLTVPFRFDQTTQKYCLAFVFFRRGDVEKCFQAGEGGYYLHASASVAQSTEWVLFAIFPFVVARHGFDLLTVFFRITGQNSWVRVVSS